MYKTKITLVFSIIMHLICLLGWNKSDANEIKGFAPVKLSESPPVDGDLSIELISAYNYAVDSNSPLSGPGSAHIAVKVCNNGTNDMTNVKIYVGDFIANTPGVFRKRTVVESTYSGTFSFEHAGNCDAREGVREIAVLAAGECSVQYWLIDYPRVDTLGNSVAGGNSVNDDLWLEYDGWATAMDAGVPKAVNGTWKTYMRQMLSASANKAWPNGTAKVPDQYLQIFQDSLGWRPDTSLQYAGCAFTIEGIWYDMGRINKGYDNDGDLVPDYNAFLQTVGNASLFDACCFRLIKTYGVLIIKLNDGGEQVIAFEDQLYHSNLPQNNTGAVGLVFYQYIPLSAPCSAIITPYQTVASGQNNEKYSGDFGITLGGPTSYLPNLTLAKTGPVSAALGAEIEFTLTSCNYSGKALGGMDFGLPLVISDSIPAGTVYVSGSAAANNNFPPGITASIFYSTNGGNTWTSTQPPASLVTDVEWRLDQNLPNGVCVAPTFKLTAPLATYTKPVVINEASIRVANGDPFIFAYDTVLIQGIFTIGDTIFHDNGASGGIKGNGKRDGAEPGLANISVSLYWDANADTILNAGDIFMTTVSSNAGGRYTFNNLTNSDYIAVVDLTDPDIPAGAGLSTGNARRPVNILGSSKLNIDYGFIAPIRVKKTITSGTPAYEGQYVSYSIDIFNDIVSQQTGQNIFTPSTTHNSGFGSDWINPNNATGLDNGTISVLTNWNKYKGAGLPVDPGHTLLKGFNSVTPCGNIIKVEGVFDFELTGDMIDDDIGTVLHKNGVSTAYNYIPVSLINSNYSPASDYYYWDITTHITSWTDINQMELGMWTENSQGNGWDGVDLLVDAIFAKITVDNPTCGNFSAPFNQNSSVLIVPLKDTYNPAQLTFLYASVVPDTIKPTLGQIIWNNTGLLDGGKIRRINVTFEAKEPVVSGELMHNIARVTSAKFGNGLNANTAVDTATTTLIGTASIGDLIYNSVSGLGVPGVRLTMTASINLTYKGTFYPAGTPIVNYTDSLGRYFYHGLLNGIYTVTVDVTSIPGTITQTFDPDGTFDNRTTVVISNANNNFNADFGYQIPNAARGSVVNDIDKDGAKSSTDPGIKNVSVLIYNCGGDACFDANDVLVQTRTTDSLGVFLFGNLPNNTYYIVVNTATLPPPGGSDYWTARFDPDNSIPPNNTSQSFALVNGQFITNLHFGFSLDGTKIISGNVYEDWNADSIQTAGTDAGIAGLIVRLYSDVNSDSIFQTQTDLLVGSMTTDANGNYSFGSLANGRYWVVIVNPPAFIPTQDREKNGDHMAYVRINGSSVSNVKFGYYPFGTAEVGNMVWMDSDGDQIVDLFEARQANITVSLFSDLDNSGSFTLVSRDTSDILGVYDFRNLPNGTYRIVVDSLDTDIPLDPYGHKAVFTTPKVYTFIVSSGAVSSINGIPCSNCNLNMDFGLAFPGRIGDQVFFDNNGNATQDPSETGIPNVTVYLCYSTVTPCNVSNALATQVTNASGNFLFTGLLPGSYKVQVNTLSLPSGMTASSQTADPDLDGVPCDDNSYPSLPDCDNQTIVNNLAFGGSFLGADFGYQPPGVIGDLVWLDLNGDGIADPGESGLANVTLTLTPPPGTDIGAGLGNPISKLTDNDGLYSFGNLPDGTYTLAITQPSGMTPIYEIDGSLNNTVILTISGGVISSGSNTWCSNPSGCDLDIDFGYTLNGNYSLSGRVCMDDPSEDGVCNTGGEFMVAGTAIYLYNDDLVFLGSAIVDTNGLYSFTGLPSDIYLVSMSTTDVPFSFSRLTTDVSDTPASNINNTGTSVIQTVPVNSSVSGVDYAYVIDEDIDFGDLPSPYPTSFSDNPTGAYHFLNSVPNLYFGLVVDAETFASPNATATGDDIAGIDDEDGISFTNPHSWVVGTNGGSLSITFNGNGWLVGYMDFNENGSFLDPGEMIFNQSVSSGTSNLSFNIPSGTDLAGGVTVYARFRLFPSTPPFPALAYSGSAANGEVEDYVIYINESRVIISNRFLHYKIRNSSN